MKRFILGEYDNEKVNNIRRNIWYDLSKVDGFLNDIESRINLAISKLNDIKNISDLGNVEDCMNILKDLSSDLY